MRQMIALREAAAPTTNDSATAEITNRFWLLLARVSWVLIASIAWAILIAGLPLTFEAFDSHYRTNFGIWQIGRTQAGEITINPEVGSAAARAGILERDILLSIDGSPVSADTVSGLGDLFPIGEAGTPLHLEVRTGDGPVRPIMLIRGGDDGATLARLGLSARFMGIYAVGVELASALIFTGVALFIFWRRSRDWMALLVSMTLVQIFVGTISPSLIPHLYDGHPQWQPAFDLWISIAAVALLVSYYLFPTGRFRPRWTRVATILLLIWLVVAWFYPELYPWRLPALPSSLSLVGLAATAVGAQVYRYRRVSNAGQRQQTKWIVYGTAVAMPFGVLGQTVVPNWIEIPQIYFDLLYAPATRAFQLLLPLTIAFAILRYRLWDIDLVINRTLVYTGLTALVVLLYIVIVGGLSNLFQTQGNLIISLVATGAVAIAFQPLRDRLQAGVNRLMFGERDDPVKVLSQMGQQSESAASPDDILPNLAQTVAQALKLPYVAITLDGNVAAEHGRRTAEVVQWPLIYQSETVGQLLVAPRTPGETFSPADQSLLSNIARQAGAAVRAVSLTADLRRSRRRIVTAREEERRRIRRDLHDGLGPQLASQTLGLDAVHKLIDRDRDAALSLLDELRNQTQTAIQDIRRLVYDLRPPALDQLGLVKALREGASHFQNEGLHITFDVPEHPLQLSAAVEVAAYRIVQEAVTNVIRHAQATTCTIKLALVEETLHVEIIDDGQGIPDGQQSGVGLQSMRERAEELNGRLTITSPFATPNVRSAGFSRAPGAKGTRVSARIPIVEDRS